MPSRIESLLQNSETDTRTKDDLLESRSEKRMKREYESASDDLEHYVISKFPERESEMEKLPVKSRTLLNEDNNNTVTNSKILPKVSVSRDESSELNAYYKRIAETNVIRHTDSSHFGFRDIDSSRLEHLNKRNECFDELPNTAMTRQDSYGAHYGNAVPEFCDESRTQEAAYENKYYRPSVMPHVFYSSLYDPYGIDKKFFRI